MALTKLSGSQIESPVEISAVNLTGVTTAQSLLVVGSGSTSRTPDQPLQVIGSAYISSAKVGIGTTLFSSNPAARGAYIFGEGNNTVLRVQSGGSGNTSAELDLISNGTQNAFIDYGPNSLVYRTTNTDGSALVSNVLLLDNNGRLGINTSAVPGSFPAKLNIFADGVINQHTLRLDTNTKTANSASIFFTNIAGAGTSDNFSAGFVIGNGYNGPAINNTYQFQIANGNPFPRTFAYVDRNSFDASFFALSSNLNESLFKVGMANDQNPAFVVDSRNNKVGIATSTLTVQLNVGGNANITGFATVYGHLTLDGFYNPGGSYISLRDGYKPYNGGGVGFAATDFNGGNNDGLGIYGQDGIGLYTSQIRRMVVRDTASGGVVGISSAIVNDSGRYILKQSDSIIQVKHITYYTGTSTNSTSYVDAGPSITITPHSTSSKILVFVSQAISAISAGTNVYGFLRLLRDATTLWEWERVDMYQQFNHNTITFSYLDTPASTSSLTYKTQIATIDSAYYIEAQHASINESTITLMEISG